MKKKYSIWFWVGIGAVALILVLVVAKKAGWLGDSNTTKVSAEKVQPRDIIEPDQAFAIHLGFTLKDEILQPYADHVA